MPLTTLLAGAVLAAAPFQDITDSLPRTTGEVLVPSLRAPVDITRDELGIPVIRAVTLADACRAQGFVHAQDRFFQMDASRRLAAGRLAEIAGRSVLDLDRSNRRYRFAQVAREVVARAPAHVRELLDAYTDGVNAGLADLEAPPPVYAFLRVEPEPWRPEDSMLVNASMFSVLNHNASLERSLGVLHEALPPELVAFLTPEMTEFDAPLIAGVRPQPPPVPGPEIIDLRQRGQASYEDLVETDAVVIGSNNWAVAGSRAVHGGAMIANDPHLQVTAPGIWYRSELEWLRNGGRAAGLSLPGSPGIVIGSNGRVAWGFTNSQADFQDLVVIEVHPNDRTRYRTPEGWEPFEEIVEMIAVAGERPRKLTLRKTRWGIVTGVDAEKRPLVLKWTALDPEMINFRILDMHHAATLAEALDIAAGWYGPSQNCVVADREGRIGWVVSGYLPKRVGFDGRTPVSWARPGVGWDGPLDEAMRPRIVDPPEGILYTANNRTVDVAWARTLGNGWALGARASRIAELLRAKPKLSEADMLAIQLDTRVEVFDFYAMLILEMSAGSPAESRLGQARQHVSRWNGHADADQPAMRILNACRRGLHDALVTPLVAPARKRDASFRFRWRRLEGTVRRLLEQRPEHLLPPGHESWYAFIRATIDKTLAGLIQRAPEDGLDRVWGADNMSAVRHPLTQALPAFGAMLDMPAAPLSGHQLAVRVATPSYGASTRMVVGPSRPGSGYLHIPAGQSGHPMSPHYRDSHPAWLAGEPTPFTAGRTRSRLRLVPRQ
ncbi:MAG: penicillin acylase family protein [Planctomycetes bacterium]|nr:penicillin acylase family protein [Planctomycetota bacterium]